MWQLKSGSWKWAVDSAILAAGLVRDVVTEAVSINCGPPHTPPMLKLLMSEGVAAARQIESPQQAYERLHALDAGAEMWVFGYASLIWRPEFEFAERRMALAYGWHRALRMRSRVNRGTPQTPGLVFALLRGGACRGFAYRMHAHSAKADIERLWAREMPNPVYEPRLLPLRTSQGQVLALAFTLNRRSDACLPRLDDKKLLDILRQAEGRYGTTLDYLVQTCAALREHQLFDSEIERQVALARRHGLV